MKIMSYNILESGEGRIDPIAESIRQSNAHVVVLQETWDRALAVKLANRVGMELFLAENPRNAEGGVALLSSLEILEAVNHGPRDPRIARNMFHAVVLTPKKNQLPIIGLHLHARETVEDEKIRLAELPALFDIAAPFKNRPHILAGDFNAMSPVQPVDVSRMRPKGRARIDAQKGVIPREVITQILAAGYVDSHTLHHSPAQMQTSFTTSHPATRVDYIFVSSDLASRVQSSDVFTSPIGRFASDHFPVVAEILI